MANNKHIKLQKVSRDYAVHVVGEDMHDYLVSKVLTMKAPTHREFIDAFGNPKFLRFVPLDDVVEYFVDDGKI